VSVGCQKGIDFFLVKFAFQEGNDKARQPLEQTWIFALDECLDVN
jgi:hypothetical protein